MLMSEVTGYALVLPPGWQRIPVRHGTQEAVRELLDVIFARMRGSVPREQLVRPRIELRRRLLEMADAARQQGGIDLYLPTENMHGATVPASIVVSENAAGGPDAGGAEQLVAYLAVSSPGGTPVTIDGAIGVRLDHTAAPDPAREVPLGSRRVDYLLSVPGHPGRWLMIVFSTVGDGDPAGQFAALLTGLFDAIMTTFRWTRS